MISTYSEYKAVLDEVDKQADTVNKLANDIAAINVTPTVQEKLLKEYYVDYNNLTKQLNAYGSQTTHDVHSLSENYEALKNMVENLDLVVDDQTLRAIESLVRRQTGLDLSHWIRKIQVENIQGSFKSLTDACTEKLDAIDQRLTDVIEDLNEKNEKQTRRANRASGMAYIAVIMAMMTLVLMCVSQLAPLIKLLIVHPVGWVLVAVFAAIIGYLFYKLSNIS